MLDRSWVRVPRQPDLTQVIARVNRSSVSVVRRDRLEPESPSLANPFQQGLSLRCVLHRGSEHATVPDR
jgi:hypothetical protein